MITPPLAIIELAKMDYGSMSIANGNVMYGYSGRDIIGKISLNSANRKKTGPNPGKLFAEHYKTGERFKGEFKRYLRNGSYGYHEYNGIQPVYQNGEIVAIEGFINDTTERKKPKILCGIFLKC